MQPTEAAARYITTHDWALDYLRRRLLAWRDDTNDGNPLDPVAELAILEYAIRDLITRLSGHEPYDSHPAFDQMLGFIEAVGGYAQLQYLDTATIAFRCFFRVQRMTRS